MDIELKLEMEEQDASQLIENLSLKGPPDGLELAASYFDTSDDALQRAGMVLRTRREGSRWVQTVKTAGSVGAGLFTRPEWERDVPGEEPVLDGTDAMLESVLEGRSVVRRLTTKVERTLWLVEQDGAHIEVALDRGEVIAEEQSEPFAELELELKDGPVGGLFALARTLAERAPLRLGVLSKAERGRPLIARKPGEATRAEPIRLDSDDNPTEAFAVIAHACLRQFRLNETLLLHGDTGPAPLHQARVGLRRLRSALSLFKPLLVADPRAAVFAGELRALAATLGEVRDIDVLLERDEGTLRDRLTEARAIALAAALDRLQSPATLRLMLDLAEWLAIGDWRHAPADASLAHEDLPTFAAHLLDQRRRRLKRRGKHLAKLDDHRRHQARIETKKLRYAAEFLCDLWSGKKARRRRERFLEAIGTLQDELGQLNDAATADAVLARLGLGSGESQPILHPRYVLRRAEKAYHHVIDAKRFWR